MNDLSRRTGKHLSILSLLGFAILSLNFAVTTPSLAPPGGATASAITRTKPQSISRTNAQSFYPTAAHSFSPTAAHSFSLADSSRLNILYDSLQLDSLGLSTEAFHKAVTGFLTLVIAGEVPNPGILSIIDFSKPSSQKRLFILDTYNGKLLFNTLVAHGRNSGRILPTRFSNRRNSFMSSLGFYLTGEPFIGQHGYSLRLEGKEKGWNDNVFSRAIIMHPAGYVSEDHIQKWGFLGRSEGCPAIPEQLDRPIIDQIRGGSCLFVYSPDKKYLHRSRLIS